LSRDRFVFSWISRIKSSMMLLVSLTLPSYLLLHRSAPADLVQAPVVDPEMVSDLVEYGCSDLIT